MDFPGGWELILVLVVLVVLFGSKKLPDAARSLGRSLRIFKAETKGLRGDDAQAIEASPTAAQAEVTQTPATQPAAQPTVPPAPQPAPEPVDQPVASPTGPPAGSDSR
jgi:sec-independent protein translocase protein TatA